MSNIDKLIELIKENHELPVIPMVDGEIPGDERGYWIADWGQSRIDEYLIWNERVYFKSDADVFTVLERFLPREEYENLPDDESKCRPYYDKLPWIKAIVVNIESLWVWIR